MSESLKVHNESIQHNFGKLPALEGIKLLFDEDTFVKILAMHR